MQALPGFPDDSWAKKVPAMQDTRQMQVRALGQGDLWRREWQPTPAFLPGESPWTGGLAGYSLWGRKESDMTEQLN